MRERTNRADAAERLLGHDPGFRVRLLRAGRKGLHTAAEDPRGDGDRRYREHQDQSECGRGVDEERHPERADQREPYGGAKWFTHGATDHGHVVPQAGRELTDVPVVEESYFLGQQMIEHALPQPHGEALGRKIEVVVAHDRRDAFHRQQPQEKERELVDPRHVSGQHPFVDQALDQHRVGERRDEADRDEGGADRVQRSLVAQQDGQPAKLRRHGLHCYTTSRRRWAIMTPPCVAL